jgi:Fe/S biogenesis protein NfuA
MNQLEDHILELSDAAIEKILEVRATETDPDSLALWINVSGEQGGAYTYEMELGGLLDIDDADIVERHGELTIVVRADSVEKLVGAKLDFNPAGLVMTNPNTPLPPQARRPDMPEPDLSSPIAQQLVAILEEQINPSLASHGGRADLVAIEDGSAYLRLSGGCQGCGMAAATLSQGIEVAIMEAIPEIERIIDVTDHASGSNPYFEAAKK